MATISKDIITQKQSDVGGTPSPYTFQEGASQTFTKGEIVFVQGGYLVEIASDTPGQIVGVASADAHNTTAGAYEISVMKAHPTNLFAGNLCGAAGADYVLAQTDIGKCVQIYRDTANSRVLLNVTGPNGGANVRCFIHGVAQGSAIGDTNARVIFSFLPNFVQFLGTS